MARSWRGPQSADDWPSLGGEVAQWVEDHCVIPDGYRMGEPFRLTDEQLKFIKHFYRLYPYAQAWPHPDALRYTGRSSGAARSMARTRWVRR